MTTTKIKQSLQRQAQLRRTKTPEILAQQSALNKIMQGRKGGVHQHSVYDKHARLKRIKIKENFDALSDVF